MQLVFVDLCSHPGNIVFSAKHFKVCVTLEYNFVNTEHEHEQSRALNSAWKRQLHVPFT